MILMFNLNSNDYVELNYIPDYLKLIKGTVKIKFSDEFNSSIKKLKTFNFITEIIFGYFFNQPIDDLPNSIKYLTLGQYFNQPLNKLPKSITHLTIGFAFNQTLDKLPDSIVVLTIYYYETFIRLINSLPSTVMYLVLINDVDINHAFLINQLPSTVKFFDIVDKHNNINTYEL